MPAQLTETVCVILPPVTNPEDQAGITAATCFRVSPEVVSAEVDGDLVVLDPRSGVYYSLNPVGARFWSLASGGSTLGVIVETLLSEYDVEREVLWQDLARLIDDLQERSLFELAR